MAYKFNEFELDEQRRELRLRGREITVQPRVFDLLVYLIRHRDRVVGKAELLDALWPGTIVVDGALQRVVSLARAALEQGKARDAIRTYSRRGYRFCGEVDSLEPPTGAETESPALELARAAFARKRWDEAVAGFAEADAAEPLRGADLEQWAHAAHWIGDAPRAIAPLERALAAYSTQNDQRGAARAALLLSEIQFERLQISVSKGWLKRAQSLLADAPPCRELGLAHYTAARVALLEGKIEECLRYAEQTRALGAALGDPDLVGLGLAYRGHALLSMGNVTQGVDNLDEAAAAALAGDMSPWVTSLIYCSVIWGCRNRGDWDRAAQWTDQFNRWCERTGLTAFPGTCRLHRAEVLSVRGELAEAEREINESTALLSRWAPWAEGDAYRVLGDLRLAQGDLDGAEESFRRAHELGWDPQPGYAMLQLARGHADAAVRVLEHALADPGWANCERRGLLLADLVIVAAAAGELERGRAALDELDRRPELWSGTAVEAVVQRARGEIEYREGQLDRASSALVNAVKLWRDAGSPLNAAAAQLRLAEIWIEAGEPAQAELELSAAQTTFAKLGVAAMLDRCALLRQRLRRP